MQHLAVDVRLAPCLQLAADVGGDDLDVALQAVHVLEDGVVDALQHIVGRTGLGCDHFVRVVNQSRTQGAYLAHGALRVKMFYNG